jgi:hypothetical protein
VPVSNFSAISANTVYILLNKNIKTSKNEYNLAINPNNISIANQKMGIKANELQELSSLCDLSESMV